MERWAGPDPAVQKAKLLERVNRLASPTAERDAGSATRRWMEGLVRLTSALGAARWFGLALVAALAMIRVWDPAPVETLRLRTFDLYQFIQPRERTPQPVAVVDLDEESLAEIGQWPWPRTVIAELVERITEYGGVAIAFDIVFAEPDRMSPGLFAESLTGVEDELREELRRLPSNDRVFAEVIRRSRVVLGQSGYQRDIGSTTGRPVTESQIATIGPDPRPHLFEFPGVVRNIPELEDAALGRAMFTLIPERDGIVRRVPAVMMVQGVAVPTLVLELLRVATGQDAFLIKTDAAGIRSVGVAGVEIPTDREGRVWVHYSRRDPGAYISAKDLLEGRLPKESLAGKLVLVGSSATALFDVESTPLEAAVAGVEIQAQLLETILSGSFLSRPNNVLGAEVLLTIAVGLLIVALVPVLGAFYTLLLGAVVATGLSAGSWYLYAQERILFDVAYTLAASLAIYVFLLFANYFREETQRRQVRTAFSQYLSPTWVEYLARHPDRLVLGGETKEMSFLFCDVRGFTMIAELYKSDPQGLTRLMNRFLTPLTNAIVEHRGTVDKYMGDAIMAFWNAPIDDDRHAVHACESALTMIDCLKQLNETREREASTANQPYLPLHVGIGINTGDCVVGNIGSDLRFDYSVLGDSVNLASRLEGQTRTYGIDVIVGSSTAAVAKSEFALLELDLIKVKGKTEPERIYGLIGGRELAQDPGYRALLEKVQEMSRCYRARDWDAALQAAMSCRSLDPGLGLDEYFDQYEARIRAFQSEPPPSDWDGVFEAQIK